MKYQVQLRVLFVLSICLATVVLAVYDPQEMLKVVVMVAVAGPVCFVASLVDWKRFANTRLGTVLFHPIAAMLLSVTLIWLINFGMQSAMPKGATKGPMNVIAALTTGAMGYFSIRDWLSRKK